MDRSQLVGKLIDLGVVSFKRSVKVAGVRREELALAVHPAMALAFPETRKAILEHLESELVDLRQAKVDSFAAVGFDSLPWAAWLADRQEKPLIYLTEMLGETGEQRHHVEGFFLRNHFVVCVESVLDNTLEWVSALRALRQRWCRVPLLLAIVDANPKVNQKSFAWLEVPFAPLCALDEIVDAGVQRGLLKKAEATRLLKGFYAKLKPVPKPKPEDEKKKHAQVHDLDEHGH
ncbi:MAG TPA: hypothetical protein HA252_03300 [Candidatus Diapherotrites archaeon]|uniref:Uncharacterized protein n=1 Tax=Candidatus Iainarchaeum sp. TaxID=3101447 RepID=A0A7J4JMD2_9ARCH|nr:hypothetical protein [Candidatus Diapherotrites archaeon]HIH16406.1 hypothetical protein [Candidatus Diapherotrites archaeon]